MAKDIQQHLSAAFKTTLASIKKRKVLFALLIILQLLIFATMAYSTGYYIQKVLLGTQGVLGQLEKANFDPQKINAGQPFLENLSPLYESYKIMKENALRWLFWLYFIIITGGAWAWLGSHAFLEERPKEKNTWKQFFKNNYSRWLRYVFLATFSWGIALCLFFVIVKFSFTQSLEQKLLTGRVKTTLFLIGFIYYLFCVAAAHLSVTPLRRFLKSWLNAGIKKIYYSLPVALFVGVVIVFGAYFFQIGLDQAWPFLSLVATTIALAAIIVAARIFWIAFQSRLKREG